LTTSRASTFPIDDLRAGVRGRVITPDDDDDYDTARTLFYGGMDRRPIAIVRATGADDVGHAIRVTRDAGVDLAVRSGGHSVAGHSVIDDAVVIDLGAMRGLDLDASDRTAWAETGLTTGEYTVAAAEHGLGTGFGDTGSVGIGGITLGGGVGFLVRAHGLTIDSLLAAEVVTADGEVLRVDGRSHPDLFWALRGGGGNFGVATRFRFRLHEVGTVVGGMLLLPADADSITSFVAAAEEAPESVSTIANVMPAPPMPMIHEEAQGRTVIFGLLVATGPVEEAERAVAPIRSIAEPILDMVRAVPYPAIFQAEEAQEEYHPVAASRTMFRDGFDRSTAETVLEHLDRGTGMLNAAQIRVLGGAMARVPDDVTAFAHRRRRMMVNVAALYQDPAEAERHETWASDLAGVLREGPEGYVNFLGEVDEAEVRAAYPGATWDRLREVKRRYDPDNVFRHNQNVPPAEG
jgi:FAD/FMN-containing dehydrogenase